MTILLIVHSIPVSKSCALDHKLDALVDVTFDKHLVNTKCVFDTDLNSRYIIARKSEGFSVCSLSKL